MSVMLLFCQRDPGALSTKKAHSMMQLHLECSVETCQVRRRARNTLVEAQLMVLDERAAQAPVQ
ncbi:hypothetical protein ACFPPE_18120 [Agromyces tardus]|uniref:hypothetical protein n=1 Tax=Agromyces tardus TaxID=2583849 RepID=UPI00361A1BB3